MAASSCALSRLSAAEETLRQAALGYPDVIEEFPWGHRALKVGRKTFAFLVLDDDGLSLSLKLPASAVAALMFTFASPTEYGLGRSGWITARFAPGEDVPLPLLLGWLDESFRAIAPKRIVAALGSVAAPSSKRRRPGPRSSARR